MGISKKQSEKMRQDHNLELCIKSDQHSKQVRKLCKQIAKGLENYQEFDIDRTLLFNAAELHDIAKFDKGEKHHKKAKQVISEEYKKLTGKELDEQELVDLSEIIKAHKGKKFDPPENVALEAAILRMADKIDHTAHGKKDAKERYKKHMRAIKKSKLLGSKKAFKHFKKACKKVRKHAKD